MQSGKEHVPFGKNLRQRASTLHVYVYVQVKRSRITREARSSNEIFTQQSGRTPTHTQSLLILTLPFIVPLRGIYNYSQQVVEYISNWFVQLWSGIQANGDIIH